MPRYFLGVDGGQSTTTALICDELGEVLASAVAGPCNHVSGAEATEKFRRVIGGCVTECCLAAQLPADLLFTGVCCGFSGGPADKEHLTRELVRSERYYITHDAEIALSGALAGEPGIIVISGTGSMAFGKNAAGQSARAGGWGFVLGDEGGAFDLVRRSVRAALQFEERWGPPTALRDALIWATESASILDLVHRLYTPEWPRPRIATLAPVVTAAARDGDSVALQILQIAAAELARYAQGVYSQLFNDEVLVSAVGGTLQSDAYRSVLETALEKVMPCRVIAPRHDPATGALLMARQL